MSVELDWEIDDLEDGEGPPAPDARNGARRHVPPARPRTRRVPRWLPWLALVVVLALGGTLGWLNVALRGAQARDDQALREAIALEARAYAQQDEELFMSRQDPNDPAWHEQQRQVYFERVDWPKALAGSYALRIIETRVEGDQAWAVVEEARPERPMPWYVAASPARAAATGTYRHVSFYRRAAAGWVHSAPIDDSSYWGSTRTLTRGRYTVIYPQRDEAVVRNWLDIVSLIAEQACGDLGCSDDLSWTITLSRTSSAEDVRVSARDAERQAFSVPAPSLSGYRTDGKLDGQPGFLLLTNALFVAIRDSGGRSLVENGGGNVYSMMSVAIFFWELRSARDEVQASWVDAFWDRLYERMVAAPLHGLFGAQPQSTAGHVVPLTALGPAGTSYDVNNAGLAETYSLVDYVAHVYGRGKLGTLLRASLDSASASDALLSALGPGDLRAFERAWLEYSRQAYSR